MTVTHVYMQTDVKWRIFDHRDDDDETMKRMVKVIIEITRW